MKRTESERLLDEAIFNLGFIEPDAVKALAVEHKATLEAFNAGRAVARERWTISALVFAGLLAARDRADADRLAEWRERHPDVS